MSDPASGSSPPGLSTEPSAHTHTTDSFVPDGRTVDADRGITWITDAFGLFSRSALGWIAFSILLFILLVAFSIVPFLGQFLFSLVSPVILAGAMVAARALERGETMKPEHFLAGFAERPVPLLIVGAFYMAGSLIITTIFVIIVFFTVGTAMLSAILTMILSAMLDPNQLTELITFGTIIWLLLAALVALALWVPLLMAYWFAAPLVFFHDMAPVEAMKASFKGCLKNILPFLLYGVVSLVLLIVAAIPFGLGLLVVMPVLMITMYTSYKDAYLQS